MRCRRHPASTSVLSPSGGRCVTAFSPEIEETLLGRPRRRDRAVIRDMCEVTKACHVRTGPSIDDIRSSTNQKEQPMAQIRDLVLEIARDSSSPRTYQATVTYDVAFEPSERRDHARFRDTFLLRDADDGDDRDDLIGSVRCRSAPTAPSPIAGSPSTASPTTPSVDAAARTTSKQRPRCSSATSRCRTHSSSSRTGRPPSTSPSEPDQDVAMTVSEGARPRHCLDATRRTAGRSVVLPRCVPSR